MKVFCALSCGLLLLTPVRVAAVQILVKDQNGVPMPLVNLCFTFPPGSVTTMTNQSGRYDFSMPLGSTGPATVRTSRTGFTNNQATINSALAEQTIILLSGQATPLPSFCGSVSAATTGENTACERIANLEVAGGVPVAGGWKTTSRTVSIVVGFSEKPAFYRLTEFSAAERYPESQFNPDAAFAKKNVAWLPVTTPVLTTNFALTEPHYGTHHLYMQTSLALNGCMSRSRAINVVLEPAQLVNYELKGQALERFVAAAKSRGYQFRSGFRFNKKDNTYCLNNAMLLPSHPAEDARANNNLLEDVYGSFDVFDGPDLMLHWQLMDIEGSFPGLPSLGLVRAFSGGKVPALVTAPAVVYDKYSDASCPYCGPHALKRTLSWRRLVYEFSSPPPLLPELPLVGGRPGLPGSNNAVQCIAAPDLTRPDQQPSLVKLTLRGPAGEDPVNALGDLRSITPQTIQRISPSQISPRGLEEQPQPDNQTVDTPEPEKTP